MIIRKLQRKNTKGFTLLELVMVLAIIGVLVGLLLTKGQDILRGARVKEVQKTVETLKTALTEFITAPGGGGTIPRTEGTGIPTTGAALTGATDTAKGNAARLDAILLSVGKLERPLSLKMGSQLFTPAGTGNEVGWAAATQSFQMTPDAAPLRDWSAITRVEARTSNPALLPSAALGANFRTRDTATNLSANLVVAYLVIPNCPARDAYELALAMNQPQFAPVEGAACDTGIVAYASPVNGQTDVYVYLADI